MKKYITMYIFVGFLYNELASHTHTQMAEEITKVEPNYCRLLEEYCSKNNLASPVYTFNHKNNGNGYLWVCFVKIGTGNYEGEHCKKKIDAKKMAAAIAHYTCAKSGSTTGGLTKQQELKIFIDCQFAQAFQSLQQLHQVCYTAIGITVQKVTPDDDKSSSKSDH